MHDRIINEYFEWLCALVFERRYSKSVSFRKLLMCLHDIKFRYSISKDRNRAEDGADLRYRFALLQGYDEVSDMVLEALDGPCSVLEMMIALAIRCEENIMDDPNIGDRTAQWFKGMLISLGLGSMLDSRFDRRQVEIIIERFLDRKYEPNGKGGLFTIKNCTRDLRKVEIWCQLCWYLNTIV